ncbi:MAG: hypothetical protein ABJN34_14165 [Litoreibacter sp.]|uniref:hypothetical protein n=1 Tax=Litoreibacter sp. TaxID=1969459 RepID=UPI00329763BD
MTSLKTALIAATVAIAGPALADGAYIPLLTFPDVEEAATKADVQAAKTPSQSCTQLERDAEMTPDTCGSLSLADVAERKFARD